MKRKAPTRVHISLSCIANLQAENINQKKTDPSLVRGGWGGTYLAERRSMLRSGREKLDRTVQVSDMLMQRRQRHGDAGGRQTPERASKRASERATLSLLSTAPPSLISCQLSNSEERRSSLMFCSFQRLIGMENLKEPQMIQQHNGGGVRR